MASSVASRNTMAASTAEELTNPFEVTKATDFDDGQIAATWVDLPAGGGFRSLIDPRSPVAKFVLGGKGSGRTHLMRYYSSSLQALRIRERGFDALSEEGYAGIYVNCGTLNPGRFGGKGQSDDKWNAIFAYYFDLWLASRMLIAADELWTAGGNTDQISDRVSPDILSLFDVSSQSSQNALSNLRDILREIDFAVNDAAVTRELRVTIRASPGRVLFGTTEGLGRLSAFNGLQFALLLDEFENFSEAQQRYVNTLIREKRPRVGFLVGARSFGVKTFNTLGGEINREGSEFETIVLDSLHLRKSGDYSRFCRSLVARRLVQAGLVPREEEESLSRTLNTYFFQPLHTRLGEPETAFISDSSIDGRKSLTKLRGQLQDYHPQSLTDGDIHDIVRLLHRPESPLVEKLAVYLLYRAWHQQENLREAATRIHQEANDFIAGATKSLFALTMGHFRDDMVAQLLKEHRQKQRYLGFSEFVERSAGLPRGLIVALKHTFRWAVFNGESPFASGHAISEDSQRTGVREAASWFLQDLPGIGPNGAHAQRATERLGSFLRSLRFSDKPSESSLCTVSLDSGTLSENAQSIVDSCVEFSFLLRTISGHKDRNTRMRKRKLQLHPMLCPLWDLPTSRRGVVELSAEEAAAIFDETKAHGLDALTRVRLRRMNAPFRLAADSDNATLNLYD